jgi:hypothetical protein
VHPTYLRLVEAVYAPFIRVVAHFSRVDHGKGTEGLDLWSTVQELSRTSLSESTEPYRHLVRNGIAHGGITYLQKEIKYQDKRGNEEKYGDADIVRLCDDLLDTCNGLALALSLFYLTRQTNDYRLPRQVLLDELREETRTPWWDIVGCTPSEFAGKKQLIVYVRVHTSDFRKVHFSTFQSGILAERFAPGFDRYFLSLSSSSSWPGWAAFDGTKLREVRSSEVVKLEDYRSVIEDNVIFFIPKIKPLLVLTKIQNFTMSLQLHWPLAMEDLRERLGSPNIRVRNANIHRNAWGSVLRGDLFIETPGKEIDQELIRKFRRRIVRLVLREARRRTSVFSIARYLPIAFAHVAVFHKDHRRRRLASFGLGHGLVCTIQVKRLRRISVPDIIGATVEQVGGFRIAWNRAWLKTDKSGQHAPSAGSAMPRV